MKWTSFIQLVNSFTTVHGWYDNIVGSITLCTVWWCYHYLQDIIMVLKKSFPYIGIPISYIYQRNDKVWTYHL